MSMKALNKNPMVLDALDRLRRRFGSQSFDVVDHWEADLHAVGIARPDDHSTLVYFACDDTGVEFHVELEGPPQGGSDVPYSSLGAHSNLAFDRLASVVQAHLGLREKN